MISRRSAQQWPAVLSRHISLQGSLPKAVRTMATSGEGGSRNSRISGFHKLDIDARRSALEKAGFLNTETKAALEGQGLTVETAGRMIENVVGTFGMPMGVSLNMVVNGREIAALTTNPASVIVPMVVEEPSVVAAVSNVARLARPEGFTASSDPPVMIGQIHILNVKDIATAKQQLEQNFDLLTDMAHEIQPNLVKRGGGMRGMEVKSLVYEEEGEAREESLLLNFFLDCREAMGANMINTTAEYIAPQIETITGGKVGLKILSNLADRRLVRAQVAIPFDRLGTAEMSGEAVAEGIAAAYRFAFADPHRACTHNKGVMNGIDPVVVATGNDWRAIEAGAHAYAASSGRYLPLTKWKVRAGTLHGSIELPMQVGTVGGTIKVHPTAAAALQLLDVDSTADFGQVIACVGLAQNLAALKALATEGIQRGHMSMHARSVVARVLPNETEEVRERVLKALVASRDVRESKIPQIYKEVTGKDL